jgi:hypothetical protein
MIYLQHRRAEMMHCPIRSADTLHAAPRPHIYKGGDYESRRERGGDAGESQHLRDVGGRDALALKAAGLRSMGVVDVAGPTALAPVGGSYSRTGAGALGHRVAFELVAGCS